MNEGSKLPIRCDIKTEKNDIEIIEISNDSKRKELDTVPSNNSQKILKSNGLDLLREETFKCFICDNNFKSKDDIEKHRMSKKSYQCVGCAMNFIYKKQFLLHECEFIDYDEPIIKSRNIIDDNDVNNNHLIDYGCKFCFLNKLNEDSVCQFEDYDSYMNHINMLHRANIECSLCYFKTNIFTDYLRHLEIDHSIELPDEDCDEESIIKNTVVEPEYPMIETYGTSECGLCKFTIGQTSGIENMNTHILSHVITGMTKLSLSTKKIYCSECKVIFNYQHDFDMHLFNHVLDNYRLSSGQLYCPVCEERNENYNDFAKFNEHYNNHLNFSCGICNEDEKLEKIQSGHQIESHYMNYHLGESVLKLIPDLEKKKMSKCLIEIEKVFCSDCNRFFKDSSNLKKHLTNESHIEKKGI